MFTDPLSPEDLYWIGYIRADGHLMKPRTETQSGRLVFSQKYKDPVEALHKYVNGTGNVSLKPIKQSLFNAKESNCYVFSQIDPYENLVKLGVKENLREDIYNNLHFWRGMIDGDGCICLTKSSSSASGKAVTVTLCASEIDINRYVLFLKSIGIKKTRIYSYISSFKVALGSEPASYLLRYLYDGHYSALVYKREKAEVGMKYLLTRSYGLEPYAREFLHKPFRSI